MADGVTRLGGGWERAAPGTAEHALGELIAAGALTDEAIIQELIRRGNGSRGPAYYPPQDGSSPFYALGNPHNYAALNDARDAWDLIIRSDEMPRTDTEPAPAPTPAPAPSPDFDQVVFHSFDEVDAAITELKSLINSAIIPRLDALRAQSDANTAKIIGQHLLTVEQANQFLAGLAPIVEAALPALAGLFTKR